MAQVRLLWFCDENSQFETRSSKLEVRRGVEIPSSLQLDLVISKWSARAAVGFVSNDASLRRVSVDSLDLAQSQNPWRSRLIFEMIILVACNAPNQGELSQWRSIRFHQYSAMLCLLKSSVSVFAGSEGRPNPVQQLVRCCLLD